MSVKKFTFIETPGHGYISVSKKDIKKYMTEEEISQISHYSGMNFTRVFLEEDADASLFIKCLIAKDVRYEFKESYRESFSCTHCFSKELFDYVPNEGDFIQGHKQIYKIDSIGSKLKVIGQTDGRYYGIPKSNPYRYIVKFLNKGEFSC